MKRVLRSLIDFDGKVSLENLRRNYFVFTESQLEFPRDQDEDIWRYIREFFGESLDSDLPNHQSIRDYFEAEGRPDVIDRIDEIDQARPYIRSNFQRLTRDLYQEQRERKLDTLLKETGVIKSSGLKMGKGKNAPLKKGVRDAVEHFISGADELLTVDARGKLKGDITADGDEVVAMHAAQQANPKIGRLLGLNHVDRATKGLRPGELMLMLGFVGELKCVVGDTLVIHDGGLERIQGLCPSEEKDDWFYEQQDRVWTKDGWSHSSHFYYGGEKETFRLVSQLGYEVVGTPNHPVLVRTEDGQEIYKRLDEVSLTDCLCIDRNVEWPELPYVSTEGYSYIPRPGRFKNCKIPDVVDEDLGRLLGYYIALSQNPGDAKTDIFKLTESLFGVRLKDTNCERPNFGYYSKKLRMFLEWVGVPYTGSFDKEVPWSILKSPKSVIREFLRGYFEGDRWPTTRGAEILASTRSERLSKDLQTLLLLFGIISSRTEHEVEGKPNYLLGISGEDAVLFKERIGFVSERPSRYTHYDYWRGQRLTYQKLRWYVEVIEQKGGVVPVVASNILSKNYYYDPVAEKSPAGRQKVYDFTIPDGHNFWSNGIISHNTTLALNYAYNTAIHYGWNVMYFSIEMKYEQVRNILYCIHSTHEKFKRHEKDERYIDYQRLRDGELSQAEVDHLVLVAQDFKAHQGGDYGRIIVERPSGDITVPEIKLKAEVEHRKQELGLLIADHAGLIENDRGRSVSNFGVSLNYVLKDLSQLALNFNEGEGIPVCSPFQANRQGWKDACKNDGHYKLDALSWASEAERSASLIIYTFLGDTTQLRDNGEVKLGCLKNRDGTHFKPYTAAVHFQSRRISNPVEMTAGETIQEMGLGDPIV